VGNGTAVAGVGGDLPGGVETAAIVSNSGNVTLSASTGGALSDGAAGDSIPWTQITTTAATNTSGTALPHRYWSTARVRASFSPHRQRSSSVKTQSGPTLTRNSVTVPAGTYGGTAALNGRVTYTASMP